MSGISGFGGSRRARKRFAYVAVLVLASAIRVEAAGINFTGLNAQQGYNFNASVHAQVGFITGLTVDSTNFAPDIKVINPATGGTMHVVGVLDSETWAGAASDTIAFHGRISTANKNTMAALLHGTLSSLNVTFNFEIFDYSSNYFETFGPLNNQRISALVDKIGSAVQNGVSNNPNTDIIKPVPFDIYHSFSKVSVT